MKVLRLPLLLLSSLVLAPLSLADVIIGNFGAAVGVGTAFGSNASTVEKAFGFTMGAQDAQLSTAVLSLNMTTVGGNPVVSIWSDAGGPSVELVAFDNPAVLSGQADYEFTLAAPFTLQANTTYWLHVRSDPVGGPAFTWDGTSPSTFPTGAGATGIQYLFNGNNSTFYNRFELRSSDDVQTFCEPAGTNSAGTPVDLSTSFTGPGVVHLEAAGGPPAQFGYFLVGATVVDPGVAVSQGFLCLATPQGRYNGVGGVNSLGQFDPSGLLQNLAGTSSVGSGFDVPASLPSPPGGVIVPGSTWHFQLWYRDGPNSNFSNGVSVTFP